MKICFLTHNLRQDNGIGILSRRLIEGLHNAFGTEVIALTTVEAGEPYERPILHPNKLRLLGRIPEIRRTLRGCDVIHSLDVFPYGLIAALALLGLEKKMIITAIGSGSILLLYRPIFASLLGWTYRRADRVSAISAFTRDEILRKIPGLSIAVINPGVDADLFSGTGGAHYDASRFKPYILGVGQLRWRKGYHLSIPAFAKVKEAFPELHYVIVGKKFTDIYHRRLAALVRELGLEDSVHILEDVDTREKLIDIYRGAELFCLFSQNMGHDVEGFGLVFLEAAAAGLPVVGSKNCGVDDAVRDGENGILVAGRSPDDFAEAILSILRDPEKKKVMSKSSLAFAHSITWERQIARYALLYRELLRSGMR